MRPLVSLTEYSREAARRFLHLPGALCVSLGLLWLPSHVAAQGDVLQVRYVISGEIRSENRRIPEAFDSLLVGLRRRVPALRFSRVEATALQLSDDCRSMSRRTIAMLSPGKFVECRRTMRPILIVKKTYESHPYYSASFVAGAGSPIRSLADTGIKRLVVVGPHSASGFIAPLHKLWEDDIIAAPTPDGVVAHGWHLDTVPRHQLVIDEVEHDSTAIGAVGMYDADLGAQGGRTQTLLSYYAIPQDVIAVSLDMFRYAQDIEYVLKSMLERDATSGLSRDSAGAILRRASTAVADVVPYTEEYRNAYTALIRMQLRVDGGVVPLRMPWSRVWRLIPLVVLTAFGMAVIGFGIGRFVHFRQRDVAKPMRLDSIKGFGLAIILISTWVFLFFSSSYYVSAPIAFFLLLACSAFAGTLTRRTATTANLPPFRNRNIGTEPTPTFVDELTLGLLFAFGFSLLYIADALLLNGRFGLPQSTADFARIAGTMSVMGFFAAFLREDAARLLRTKLRSFFPGSERTAPNDRSRPAGVPAVDTSHQTLPGARDGSTVPQ